MEDVKLEPPARRRILNVHPRTYLHTLIQGENSCSNLPRNSYESTSFDKDFSKYLPTEAEVTGKQPHHSSNFREEYEKQLRKMDGRRTRLSAAAKGIIMRNILKEAAGRKRNTSIFSSIR